MRLASRASAFGVLTTIALLSPGTVAATGYDGTNPGATPCGNGSHPVEVLYQTNIMYGSQRIGMLELRQSKYCATVWARVYNYTSQSLQAHETLVTYSSPNLAGRTEYQYPTIDTLPPNGSGWSNQYYDRPAFAARGALYYQGAWRWAETLASLAWVQKQWNYPSNPYSCDHSSSPCYRWPTNGSGSGATSVQRYYYIAQEIDNLPSGGGSSYYDASGDVIFTFNGYNGVNAPNPFMNRTTDVAQSQVQVYGYSEPPSGGVTVFARGDGIAPTGSYLFTSGFIKMNVLFTNWGPAADVRNLLCHEAGHVYGEGHNSVNDRHGSRAGCMSGGLSTGPSFDDQLALNTIYRGSAP
jgi:hypothetical protein